MPALSNLVAFAHVAQAGSFSGGAERLGIATSVASKRVSKLERALGVRLLHRTTRRLSLTEAGEAYLEHCARILDEVELAEAAVGRLRGKPRGLLRVTAPSEFSAFRLAPLLPQFLTRFPEVAIELDASDRVVGLVQERYDLGVRILREPPPGLAQRRLAPLRSVLCASPAYLKRRGTPHAPEDLERHDCLSIPDYMGRGEWLFARRGREYKVRVRGRCTSNSSSTLRTLALAGAGIALLPDYVAGRDLEAGALRAVLADCESYPGVAIYAVYAIQRFVPPKLRAFIDFVAARLDPGP
jgi:DNA-binding transcriptional LysR family regulator